jgi:methionyl-tRNA synthetase
MTRRILVTSALPYANGDIHLGHLLEYIQTDIWARFMRMQGHEIYYICADDTHGTAIMLKAQKEGVTPETLIDNVWQNHTRDFSSFDISFDAYHSTHAPENQALCYDFFEKLKQAGLIIQKEIEQAFDAEKNIFLPDRFIKGTCPKCKTPEQYGDSCENCGATYQPTELIDAYSVLSNTTPILKKSIHYFFALSDPRCAEFLKQWVQRLEQEQARNKLSEWLDASLHDWDISRDAPYFGFKIPGEDEKYFYVWLDAPVGYYAGLKYLAQQKPALKIDFDEWVSPQSNVEQYHFIGKDILYFHTLFWPSMLHFANYKTPTNVFAHGFITINGQKMSKSRGTFITARSYIESGLDSSCLRYYIASKLNASIEDMDLNFDDFMAKINSDLVGKFVNLASRSAGFLNKFFDNRLSAQIDHLLIMHIKSYAEEIAQCYEAREFAKAVRLIMHAVDEVNAFVDQEKPWLMKDISQRDQLQFVCSLVIESFKILTIYLKPILPNLTTAIEYFLNTGDLKWSDLHQNLAGHQINSYQHLIKRIEPAQIDVLLEKNRV